MTDYRRCSHGPRPARAAGSWWCAIVVALALAGAGGCAAATTVVPPDTSQPDQFLMERGTEALERRRWADAREYFRQIVDNYPQSIHRPEAKLGLAESYFGEGGTESLLRATNEYREFLTFFPTHPRADHAQFQMAMTSFRQMRSAGRDQTETEEALRQFQTFFDRFPNSPLFPEVRARWREARDRLSEHIYGIGMSYFRRQGWYPGAIDRFREILRDDPEYTHRDAVYYHLAESLARMGNTAEAIPYFQRVVTEFDESEHLASAKRRLAELQ
jgi:outer membrane protein assembly factor BamD